MVQLSGIKYGVLAKKELTYIGYTLEISDPEYRLLFCLLLRI